jgi:hypothetical protein
MTGHQHSADAVVATDREAEPYADTQSPSEVDEREQNGTQVERDRAAVLDGHAAQIAGIETVIDNPASMRCVEPHQKP